MFDKIFLQILNMNFTASFVIAIVLVARLLLKKAPKIFSYALWSAVLYRLVCPVSFESVWSLLPVNLAPISTSVIYSEEPRINTGITSIDNIISFVLPAPAPGASINPLQVLIAIGKIIWIFGIATILLYNVVSLLRLYRKLVGAVKLRDNIYLADHITSPFVIGLIRPKIYLPSTLSEREISYIILHEQMHIRRFDHIVKILAFAALAIHWFNPLVWVAFIISGRDMEMSCDESVMKRVNTDIRSDYSASLLSLATGRKIITGTPLAFGEGDTKERIKNLMNYKKPTFWVIIAAFTVVITVCVGLIANPRPNESPMQWVKDFQAVFDFGNDSSETILTFDALKSIAKKGESITWDDFSQYSGTDVGSGLYIRAYDIDENYYVLIGGPSPNEAPWYVRLYNAKTDQYIDVGKDSIDDFIK